MASINIKVKSDFAQASKDLKSFGNVTAAEAKRVEAYLKNFKADSIDSFIDKNRKLGAGMKANKGDISAIITQQKALEKQSISLIAKGLDPEDKAIEKLNDEYNRLQKEYDETTKASKAMETASKAASVALLAIGAAAVGVAVVSSKMALEYTKSLANINTMIDVTADEMSNLNDEMTGVSNEFAIQKSELSAGVYQALSAGAEDLSEAMDIVTKSAILGKGALIDTASSVDIVTTAMNAYGNDVVDASLATDVFFNIIKQGKINGEQLSATIGQSITLFSAAKISVEELGAGIATLTKVGVKSSEATTQLNGVVNAFLKPTEALSAAMAEVGFESGSALLETEGLKGALEFLSTATGGSVDKMAELIPNIRGMRGALALSSNGMATYNDVAESFNDVSGLANEAMLKQTDGFAKNAFTVEQSIIIFKNLSESIGQKLIPTLGSAASELNDFMMDSDKLNKTLTIVGLSLAGVTAGLATFLLLSKGAAVIQTLSTAFVALNLAMKANPVIFIASAITAILIPAIILLVKNWDKVAVVLQTSIAVLGQAFTLLGVNIKTSWTVAINALKLAWLSLGSIIVDKVLGGVQMFLDLAGKIPFVGDKFKDLSNTVGDTKDAFNSLADEAKNNTVAVIQGAANERLAVKEATEENIKNIKLESKERLAALKAQEEANAEATQVVIENSEVVTAEVIEDTTAQEDAFIASSAGSTAAVVEENEKKKASYEEYFNAISNLATKFNTLFQQLSDNQIDLINDVSDAQISAIDAETQAKLKALGLQDLSVIESLNVQLQAAKDEGDAETQAQLENEIIKTGILEDANAKKLELEKERALAVYEIELAQFNANKAMSALQAGINTAVAVTSLLAFPPLAIAAGVAGLAEEVAILTAPAPPAPSFQTGTPMGGFQVPENTGSSRADNTSINVSPNENINITPRGEGGNPQRIMIHIDRQVFYDIVTDGNESGDIIISSDNIQSA